MLRGVYITDPTGSGLVDLLKSDWGLFAHERMDVAHSKELLSDILDDGEVVRQRFKPSDNLATEDALQRWNDLRQELIHQNRYFPKTEINLSRLSRLFGFLILPQGELPELWFRARIQSGVASFPPGEMGSPPKHLASHGRANPAGIPYLYLASTTLTAISETRPHTGELACVAAYEIPDELKLVDLRHPRRSVSPFILSDETEISMLRSDIEFLEKLGDELTRPVLPRSAAFDYVPSQFLCEYVKVCGFDGVLYRSSVGDGVNLALFNPQLARVGEIRSQRVISVMVDFAE
ncbi:RES family NAD+ phosphorylase [Pseudomonas cichorii]|uniref:RES family NAD+ phosphorylase n=1 Tax=Pseudomonas cichorii TaxID=36746 RepID=UPI001C88E4DC|nr:RES family NAD+ phosphorylase [Pseudomonas cichorii]MBX8531216.1 RES family NAD+ phosphorylase [Pseudomonas cichorii]